jgi:hypothetical protein
MDNVAEPYAIADRSFTENSWSPVQKAIVSGKELHLVILSTGLSAYLESCDTPGRGVSDPEACQAVNRATLIPP